MSNLKTWPDKIWLQASDDGDELPSYQEAKPKFEYEESITWCDQSVLQHEVKYIRADLVEEQIKEARTKERGRLRMSNEEKMLGEVFVNETNNGLPNDDHLDWSDFDKREQRAIEAGIQAVIAEWQRRSAEPVAWVINNNQSGWTAVVETQNHISLDIGMKLYAAPQPLKLPSLDEMAKTLYEQGGSLLWSECKEIVKEDYLREAEAILELLKSTMENSK